MNTRTLEMFKDRIAASFKAAGLDAGLYQMNFLQGQVLQLKFYENRIGNIRFTFTDGKSNKKFNDEITRQLPVGVSHWLC